MIKEILIIGIIAVCMFGVFQLYTNNWNIDQAFGGITSLIGGSLSNFTTLLQTNPIAALTMIGTGVGICIPFAKLAYDGLKKESAQKIDNLSNVVVDKNTENAAITNTYTQQITDMQAELEEFKAQNTDATSLLNTIASKDEQLQKAKITIDTLHETLRRNKLTDGETIVKTIIG